MLAQTKKVAGSVNSIREYLLRSDICVSKNYILTYRFYNKVYKYVKLFDQR